MKRIGWVSYAVMVVLGFGLKAQAGLVAGWDVAGIDVDNGIGLAANGAPYMFNATTSDTSYVSAHLELGSGVNPSTSPDEYGFKISGSDETHSLAGAIAAGHYLECSLTVADGYALNLSSIEMFGSGSGTGCSNLVLMSSIDGFVAGQELTAVQSANSTGGFDTDSSGFGGPIDLSASQYQHLTGTMSFRLYGWNSTSGSGVTYLRNLSGTDLAVNGTTQAIPEPRVISLISLAGIGALLSRRFVK